MTMLLIHHYWIEINHKPLDTFHIKRTFDQTPYADLLVFLRWRQGQTYQPIWVSIAF